MDNAPDGLSESEVQVARAALVDNLSRVGVWDMLDAEQRRLGAQHVLNGYFPFSFLGLENLTDFSADGENLAEGGVERFLQTLSPSLRELGLELDVQLVQHPYESNESDYVLSVNGIECVVWRAGELLAGNAWLESTVRPLVVVNKLLGKRSASLLRMHTLNAGTEDGRALLIHPDVPSILRRSGLFQDLAIPRRLENQL